MPQTRSKPPREQVAGKFLNHGISARKNPVSKMPAPRMLQISQLRAELGSQ